MTAHLVGWRPSFGRVTRVVGEELSLDALPGADGSCVRILRVNGGYAIERTATGTPVTVNGSPFERAPLRHLDVVSVGDGFDLVFLFRDGQPVQPAVPRAPVSAVTLVTGVRLTGTSGSFVLPTGRSTVGRGDDATIRIDLRDVSRLHATLTVSSAGVLVEDNGSRNGTHVNGTRIQTPHGVTGGDRIAFGGVEFLVDVVTEVTG